MNDGRKREVACLAKMKMNENSGWLHVKIERQLLGRRNETKYLTSIGRKRRDNGQRRSGDATRAKDERRKTQRLYVSRRRRQREDETVARQRAIWAAAMANEGNRHA